MRFEDDDFERDFERFKNDTKKQDTEPKNLLGEIAKDHFESAKESPSLAMAGIHLQLACVYKVLSAGEAVENFFSNNSTKKLEKEGERVALTTEEKPPEEEQDYTTPRPGR